MQDTQNGSFGWLPGWWPFRADESVASIGEALGEEFGEAVSPTRRDKTINGELFHSQPWESFHHIADTAVEAPSTSRVGGYMAPKASARVMQRREAEAKQVAQIEVDNEQKLAFARAHAADAARRQAERARVNPMPTRTPAPARWDRHRLGINTGTQADEEWQAVTDRRSYQHQPGTAAWSSAIMQEQQVDEPAPSCRVPMTDRQRATQLEFQTARRQTRMLETMRQYELKREAQKAYQEKEKKLQQERQQRKVPRVILGGVKSPGPMTTCLSGPEQAAQSERMVQHAKLRGRRATGLP